MKSNAVAMRIDAAAMRIDAAAMSSHTQPRRGASALVRDTADGEEQFNRTLGSDAAAIWGVMQPGSGEGWSHDLGNAATVDLRMRTDQPHSGEGCSRNRSRNLSSTAFLSMRSDAATL